MFASAISFLATLGAGCVGQRDIGGQRRFLIVGVVEFMEYQRALSLENFPS
jgi:hypothetical protein